MHHRQNTVRTEIPSARVKKLQRRSSYRHVDRPSPASELEMAWRKRTAQTVKLSAVRVALAYKKSQRCMMFTSGVTLTSCAFFIVGTYINEMTLLVVVEVFFAVVFALDFVMSLLAAPVWLSYVLSFEGIVDFLSILPVFGAIKRWVYSLSFVRYLRLRKATGVIQSHRLLNRLAAFDEVTVNACLLGMKVAGLIFMTTAVIYGTEHVMTDTEEFNFGEKLRWHDALYFTIVTLSTVGYGDILPLQTFSRMLMVAVILLALTYVPLKVGNLVELINSRPKYRKGFPTRLLGNQVHVVLAMVSFVEDGTDGSGFDERSLKRIIEELFHEDHGLDNHLFWVVLMAPCPPSPEIQAILRSPRFLQRVIYFRGNVMDPLDLAAVCAEYADCIFLYPSSQATPMLMEEKTTLAAKSLQRYLDRTPTDPGLKSRVQERSVTGLPHRTLVNVKELRSKEQLLRFGIDHVICHDELKMAMLACASLFPAFLPFAINAMRSSCSCDVGIHAPTSNKASALGGAGINKSAAGSTHHRRKDSTAGASERSDGVMGREKGDHGESNSALSPWLRDYRRGTEFEVYSLQLLVHEASPLRGATFGRAALALYKLSKGAVLLLAVVHDIHDHPDYYPVSAASHAGTDGLSVKEPMRGSDNTVPAGAMAGAAAAASSADGGRSRRPSLFGVERETEGSFVHVSVFPGEDYVLRGNCNVLIFAEDKKKARQGIMDLERHGTADLAPEGKEEGKVEVVGDDVGTDVFGGEEGVREEKEATASDSSGDNPMEDVEAGIARAPLSTVDQKKERKMPLAANILALPSFPPIAPEEEPTAAAVAGDEQARPGAAAAKAVVEDVEPAATGAVGVPRSSRRVSWVDGDDTVAAAPPLSRQIMKSISVPAILAEAPSGDRLSAPANLEGVAGEEGVGVGGRLLQGNSRGYGKGHVSSGLGHRNVVSLGGRVERAARKGHSRRKTIAGSIDGGVYQTEEEQEIMESVREELRNEDGIRWTEAIASLKEAMAQLKALGEGEEGDAITEDAIAEDPAAFFAKVQAASYSLGNALRVHAAAVPENLTGHFVLIGAHPRLQYFVLGLRRRRPDAAVVVITNEESIFTDLRERLVRSKCDERSLDISRIYSVLGRMQDRGAFQEARIAQAEAVVVVSDKPGDSDVLLVSLELEQLLCEMRPGLYAPKVLIDLHNDSSICYCGNTLGRGGAVSSSFLRRAGAMSGRLEVKEQTKMFLLPKQQQKTL
ncbi:unnamed protein product [Ascophyllum nodosum]